jgi:signal transduction histidine kinase
LQRTARHLLTIVEDVLQMSRAESGHLALSPAVHRLGSAVDEVLATVETQAIERQVTLTNAVSVARRGGCAVLG